MILNNTQPIIIPAVEEKEFPHLWLKDIKISTSSTTEGIAIISAAPYNSQTKEIGDDVVKRIFINDLWKAINEVPEAAIAMGAILAAIEPLENWNNNQLIE